MAPGKKKYYGKILLFGEYSIIFSPKALAAPLRPFFGRFAYPDETTGIKAEESNKGILRFYKYLEKSKVAKHFYMPSLYDALEKGMYFDSNIPEMYGLGSSAALCAAIAGEFGRFGAHNPGTLRPVFAQMESFFHGKSSGADPLAPYYGSAIIINEGGAEVLDEFSFEEGISVYLLDTEIKKATGPLVSRFLEKAAGKRFREKFVMEYIPINNSCIDSAITREKSKFFESLKKLSHLQLDYFKEMIPQNAFHIWEKGLESGEYFIKINGSGGGGFIQAYSENPEIKGILEKESGLRCFKVDF